MFIDIVTIGSFFVVFLLVFLIGDTIAGGRRVVRRAATIRLEANERKYSKSVFGPLTQALATIVPQSSREIELISYDLKRAGYYRSTSLVEYLATRNGMIIVSLIGILSTLVLLEPDSPAQSIVLYFGIVLCALGYGLPRLLLRMQAKSRVDRIQRGLPDALDIVMMCVTGGLALQEALARVTSEIRYSHPDIASEFDIIRRQADADNMATALRNFAKRIDSPDVNALASLVSQTERMGTNVGVAVCDYADSVRRAHRQRAEERASKTSIKMLFPVILCLAPPIYILLLGPPFLKLKNFVDEAHRPGGVLAIPGVEYSQVEDRRDALFQTTGLPSAP